MNLSAPPNLWVFWSATIVKREEGNSDKQQLSSRIKPEHCDNILVYIWFFILHVFQVEWKHKIASNTMT